MTIAIGMLSSDGIVLAADSQITTDIKLWRGKISGVGSVDVTDRPDGGVIISHPGGLAIAIAGQPAGHAIRAAELIRDVFGRDKSLVGEELRQAFERELKVFHQDHIIPYMGIPIAAERPSIELLIGAYRDHHRDMWKTENAVVRSVGPYDAIGIGLVQAFPLLEKFYRIPSLNVLQTVMIAGFVVHQAKDVNPYCGKTTDMMVVRDNKMFMIYRYYTKQMDAIFDDHADVLISSGLWDVLGATTRDDRRNLTKVRRRINALSLEIRKHCLLEQ